IADAAQDLARARQRRAQPDTVERPGLALRGELVERRAQPLEIVDDALHRQLWRVALRDRAADVDDAAIGQQPRPRLGIRAALEQHQLHRTPPSVVIARSGATKQSRWAEYRRHEIASLRSQ